MLANSGPFEETSLNVARPLLSNQILCFLLEAFVTLPDEVRKRQITTVINPIFGCISHTTITSHAAVNRVWQDPSSHLLVVSFLDLQALVEFTAANH